MKHMLVVDDDVALRDVVARVLREEGYAVSTAATGEEALREVRSARPDGVLLDLVMPEMDGETFLRTIRSDPLLAKLPVAICSTSLNSRQIGRELGVEVFIDKPFELDDLIVGVETLLNETSGPVGPGSRAEPLPSVALARQLIAETHSRNAALWEKFVRAEDCLQRSRQVVVATSECLAKAANRFGSEPTRRGM